MKWIALTLAIGLSSFSAMPAHRRIASVSSIYNPCDTAPYLVLQNFETPTTGYDHCETWTETGSNVNQTYTGVVLEGTQSCLITQTASAERTSTTFTANDEVWAYCLFRPVTIDTGSARDIFAIRNGDTFLATVRAGGAGSQLQIVSGSTATTVATIATGTTYHLWLHYLKGTGANSVCDVAFSTTGIRPTSGNNFAQITDGSGTSQGDTIQLGRNSLVTQTYIFDKVRVDNAQIGDNPQ
jgi:hypothetical protein